MKQLGIILFISLLFYSCSEKADGIKVSGKISGYEEGHKAFIELIVNQEKSVVDSFNIQSEGEFETYVKVKEPGFYRVSFDRRNYANVILNDEDVVIEENQEKTGNQYIIKGSRDTDFVQDLIKVQMAFESQVQDLNNQFGQARSQGDEEAMRNLQEQYIRMEADHVKTIKKSLWAMDYSIAGILSINFLQNLEAEAPFLDSLASKYEKQLPNSNYTVELRETADSFKMLAVGALAPEIDLPTPSGENMSLSSLRGSYVLIDFWAAWCGPCRRENPNVVRMYKEYHKKGFEILSVSLDRSREKWIEAIQKDGLDWNHVSDLKYFNSQAAQTYQINAIPATFLIDPEGKIIAKNLRGPNLEAKLKEIFG